MPMLYTPEGGEPFVFVHVPRTGGRFVRTTLEKEMAIPFKYVGKHAHGDFDPNGEYAFCFTRDPMKWLRSFWVYEMAGRGRPGAAPINAANKRLNNSVKSITAYHNFDSFARELVDRYPGLITEYLDSYKKPGVLVGQTDRLEHHLAKFLADRVSPEQLDTAMKRVKRTALWTNTSMRFKQYVEITPELENYCRGKL